MVSWAQVTGEPHTRLSTALLESVGQKQSSPSLSSEPRWQLTSASGAQAAEQRGWEGAVLGQRPLCFCQASPPGFCPAPPAAFRVKPSIFTRPTEAVACGHRHLTAPTATPAYASFQMLQRLPTSLLLLGPFTPVQLFEAPRTVAYQVPLSMGFSMQEYLSELPLPSPGDLPGPEIELAYPALQAGSLPLRSLLFLCPKCFSPKSLQNLSPRHQLSTPARPLWWPFHSTPEILCLLLDSCHLLKRTNSFTPFLSIVSLPV